MEKNCMISRVERPISSSLSGGIRVLPVFPRLHSRKHPGGVASMTRDRGYPDWLVLSARLLWAGYHSAKIYMFYHVPLWLCEDITACCYMYCYFRNIFPPWSSQMTIILITNAMYHIRYTNGEYEFKRKNPTD